MNPSYFSLNLKSSFMGFCAGIPLCLSFTLLLFTINLFYVEKRCLIDGFENTFQICSKKYYFKILIIP